MDRDPSHVHPPAGIPLPHGVRLPPGRTVRRAQISQLTPVGHRTPMNEISRAARSVHGARRSRHDMSAHPWTFRRKRAGSGRADLEQDICHGLPVRTAETNTAGCARRRAALFPAAKCRAQGVRTYPSSLCPTIRNVEGWVGHGSWHGTSRGCPSHVRRAGPLGRDVTAPRRGMTAPRASDRRGAWGSGGCAGGRARAPHERGCRRHCCREEGTDNGYRRPVDERSGHGSAHRSDPRGDLR